MEMRRDNHMLRPTQRNISPKRMKVMLIYSDSHILSALNAAENDTMVIMATR